MSVDSFPKQEPASKVIQLSYRIEPDVYSRDFFFYGLAKYLLVWFYLATVIAGVNIVLTNNYVAGAAIWCYLFFLIGLLSRWSMMSKVQKNPLNRNIWAAVTAEFDESTYRVSASNGSTSQVPFKNFVKADRFRGKYLLYITAGQYVIVPASAFKSQADERAFQEILVKHGLMKSVDK